MSRLLVSLLLALPGAATLLGQERSGREITVYAAASLTDAFLELGALMQRAPSGTRVRFNFAGSQQLAIQLEQGASADVFASADQRWMRYAEDRGLTAGPAAIFAHNRLVVIVPRTNPADIGRLEDLARPGIKLVVGAEAVPAGRYTRETIRRLSSQPGFPPDYGARVLANVVSEEENVKAVVAKVLLGEADAGVAYRSDVTPRVAGGLTVLEIPAEVGVVASYPVAVLGSARDSAAARAFVRLLLGAEGRAVLARHGLVPADTTP